MIKQRQFTKAHYKLQSEHRKYYYVVGESDTTGRRIIYARKDNRLDAEKVANEIHNAHCEVIESNLANSTEFGKWLREHNELS